MDLTLNPTGGVNAVTSLSADGIRIGETRYAESLLVSAERIEHPWPITAADQLDAGIARELLAWEPEVVIVGTGSRLEFPGGEFAATLMQAGVGVEAMDNRAACRTYNVLIADGRKALAALIQIPGR